MARANAPCRPLRATPSSLANSTNQIRALADETLGLDYPGVVGNDPVVLWFVERAMEHGVRFAEPIPQQIYALRGIGEAGPDSVAQSAAGPCRREPEPVNRS